MYPLVEGVVAGGLGARRLHRVDGGHDGSNLFGCGVGVDDAQCDGHAQSGTLPCLRDGNCSRFVRSIASDLARTLIKAHMSCG